MHTTWLHKPFSLIIIGPAGVGKTHVATGLCIDELGYTLPTKEQADCLFQIISKRSEIGTTVVTTNLIPSQWGNVFETVTASAILGRLSMHGTFLTFDGRSYRSKQ